jgi:predicted HicB family RNase H-like nuclease
MATPAATATTPLSPHATPGAGPGARDVLEVAQRLFATRPDWLVFFREVMGLDGIVRQTFTTPDSLMHFECSPEYARIREMLEELRERQQERLPVREAQRVVTVRMPRSLHETLKAEAQEMNVSINRLCISKLLKLLDEEACRDLASGADEPA